MKITVRFATVASLLAAFTLHAQPRLGPEVAFPDPPIIVSRYDDVRGIAAGPENFLVVSSRDVATRVTFDGEVLDPRGIVLKPNADPRDVLVVRDRFVVVNANDFTVIDHRGEVVAEHHLPLSHYGKGAVIGSRFAVPTGGEVAIFELDQADTVRHLHRVPLPGFTAAEVESLEDSFVAVGGSFIQIVSDAGELIGSRIGLPPGIERISAASLGDVVLVTWIAEGEVRGAFLTTEGLGTAFAVDRSAREISVAGAADRFIVATTDDDGSQLFSVSHATAVTQIDGGNLGDVRRIPSVSSNGDRLLIVKRAGHQAEYQPLAARVADRDGASLTSDFHLFLRPASQTAVDVDAASEGAVALWLEEDPQGRQNLRAALIRFDGTLMDHGVLASDVVAARLAAARDRFLVAWIAGGTIVGRLLHLDGSIMSVPFHVAFRGKALTFDLAASGSDFMLTWADEGIAKAARMRLDGWVIDMPPIEVPPTESWDSAAVVWTGSEYAIGLNRTTPSFEHVQGFIQRVASHGAMIGVPTPFGGGYWVCSPCTPLLLASRGNVWRFQVSRSSRFGKSSGMSATVAEPGATPAQVGIGHGLYAGGSVSAVTDTSGILVLHSFDMSNRWILQRVGPGPRVGNAVPVATTEEFRPGSINLFHHAGHTGLVYGVARVYFRMIETERPSRRRAAR